MAIQANVHSLYRISNVSMINHNCYHLLMRIDKD